MSHSSPPGSRRTRRAQAQAFIDTLTGTDFPRSLRIYIQGQHPSVRVPMREIQLIPTHLGGQGDDAQYKDNEPVPVYDTAGPYGDPTVPIDVRAGLSPLRAAWISARQDSEPVPALSSGYSSARRSDAGLDHLRFATPPTPQRARAGRCVTQLHYTRAGIITPEM